MPILLTWDWFINHDCDRGAVWGQRCALLMISIGINICICINDIRPAVIFVYICILLIWSMPLPNGDQSVCSLYIRFQHVWIWLFVGVHRYVFLYSYCRQNGLWIVCAKSVFIVYTVSYGTNFSEILIKIENFSLTIMHLKMLSAKWRPFCPGGDMTCWKKFGVGHVGVPYGCFYSMCPCKFTLAAVMTVAGAVRRAISLDGCTSPWLYVTHWPLGGVVRLWNV